MPVLTINSSGIYPITADYTATVDGDDGIVVASGVHNVRIMIYSRIECLSTLPKNRSNRGIRFGGNNNNCKIIGMGGTIRGFQYGIDAQNCDLLEISNVIIPDALMRGMKVAGNSAFIRDNRVSNIYGSTLTPNQYCMGIEVSGQAPTVVGNIIRDFRGTGTGEGLGISITDQGIGALVKGNACIATVIADENDNLVPRPGTFGYWMGGSSDVDFVHNHAANCKWGAAASSPTMGLVDENSFRNCITDFIDSGGDWIVGGSDG